MTRTALAAALEQRGTYTATVEKFGYKSAFRGPPRRTVLLMGVTDSTGKVVADHLWLTVGAQIEKLDLKPGECITFDARVTTYTKGYLGRREDVYKPVTEDYRLSFPTRVRRLDGGSE